MDAVLSAAVEQVSLADTGIDLPKLCAALSDAADEAGVQLEVPAVRTALWRLLVAEKGIAVLLPSGRRVSPCDVADGAALGSAEAAEAAGAQLAASEELQQAAVGLYETVFQRFSMSESQRTALQKIGAAGPRGALQNDLAVQLGVENRNFFYVVKMLEQRGLVVKHPLVVKRHNGRSAIASHVTTNILHLTQFAPPGISKTATMTDGRTQTHGGSGGVLGGAGGVGGLGDEEALMVLDDATHYRRICQQLAVCAGQQASESELKVVLGFRHTRGHRLWRRIKPQLIKRGNIEEFLAHNRADNKTLKCIKLCKPWKEEDSESGSEEEEEAAVEGAGLLGRQVAELTLDRQLLLEIVGAGMDGAFLNDMGAALKLNMKRNEPRLREAEARFGVHKASVNQGRVITTRYTAPDSLLNRFHGAAAPLHPPGGWLAAVVEAVEAGLDEGEPFPWPVSAQAPQEGVAEERGQQQQQQVQQQQVQQQQVQPQQREEGEHAAAEGEQQAQQQQGRQEDPGHQQGLQQQKHKGKQKQKGKKQQQQQQGQQQQQQHVDMDAQASLLLQALAAASGEGPAPGPLAPAFAPPATALAAQFTPHPQQALAASVQQPGGGGTAPLIIMPGQGMVLPPGMLASLGGVPSRPGSGAGTATLLHKTGFTEIAHRRLDWVLARIRHAGFLLASEMPRFLKDMEEAETGKPATSPDRKTCDRVMEWGESEGLLQILTINFPATYGGLSNRVHTVLAPPGAQPDEGFVAAVYQHYQEFKRRAHGSASYHRRAMQHEIEGKTLPVVNIKPLLPGRSMRAQPCSGTDNRTLKKGRGQKRRQRSLAAAAGLTLEEEEEEDGEREEDGEEEAEEEAGVGGTGAPPGSGEGLEGGALAASLHPQYLVPNRGGTIKAMVANGFQMFRMQRVRAVHEVCCQLAGLAPPPPVQAAAVAAAAEARGGPTPGSTAAAVAVAGCDRVFVVTALPGIEEGSLSRLDMQETDVAQDEVVARRVLSARSVWEALTVTQFLFSVGSNCEEAEWLRELEGSGRCLGQLGPAEIERLCGGAQEVARAQTRLMQLLDLAYRMGLLSSVLPLRPTSRSRQTTVSNTANSCFAVRAELFVQEPAELPDLVPRKRGSRLPEAQQAQQGGGQQGDVQAKGAPGDGTGTAAGLFGAVAPAPVDRHLASFTLDPDGTALRDYWAKTQFVVCRHCTIRGFSTTATPLGRCFPFDRTPEATVERAWGYRQEVKPEQMQVLHAYLGSEDARSMTYTRTCEVAQKLGMPYEAVLAFTREHVLPSQRLGRLAVLRLGPDAFGSNDALSRKRLAQKRYYWQKRMQDLEARYPEGIPQDVLDGRKRAAYGMRANVTGPLRRRLRGHKRKGGAGSALLPVGADGEVTDREEDEDEVRVDQSALLPRAAPQPLRKKRWWKAEDRQLLTAWAGWMANKGARPILWRSAPGRPANLKHYTLKRRLTQLQANEELGSTLSEIRRLSLHIHALLTAREVAQRTAAEEQQAQQQQAQQGEGLDPSGAAAAAPAAPAAPAAVPAVVAVGSKRKAREQAAEAAEAAEESESLEVKRARADELEVAVIEAEHLAEAAVGDEADPGAGLAAARSMFRVLLPHDVRREVRQGAEGPLPEMAAAIDSLALQVEAVVASAPKQFKERPPGKAGAGGRRRPGPKPLSSRQQMMLRGSTHVAVRPQSLLRRWGAALRGSAGTGDASGAAAAAALLHPSPAVTAAMAMAQSLLYMSADHSVVGRDYETALTSRFTPADIRSAFELLNRQGALLRSTTPGRHDFRLTDRWRATLQPAGFPLTTFSEAAATARQLAHRRRLDITASADDEVEEGLASLQQGLRPGERHGGDRRGSSHRRRSLELTGGAVAAVLGGMAAGRLVLRTHRVQVTPVLTQEEAAAADGGGGQDHAAPLEVSVPVRVSLTAPRPDALAANGSEGSAAGGAGAGGGRAGRHAAGGGGRTHNAAADTAGTAGVAGEAAAEESEGEAGAEAMGEAGGEAPDATADGAAAGSKGTAETGAAAADGEAAAAAAGPTPEESLKFTHQELVLYQPVLVGCSQEVRAHAEAACRTAVEAAARIGSNGFDAALATLRGAGPGGVSRRQLAAAALQAGGQAEAAGQLLEQLLLHGLVREVCSFEGRRYAAAENSQCQLAFPHLARDTPAEPPAAPAADAALAGEQQAQQQAQQQQQAEQQEAEWQARFCAEVERLAARRGLLPGGQLQPCLDVPVRPWVDHHGRLNGSLWEALVRKALAAVARSPGLPEALLVEELGVLAPQHARELLCSLVSARVLKQHTCQATPTPAPSSTASGGGSVGGMSVLAACFGRAPSARGAGSGGKQATAVMGSEDDGEENDGDMVSSGDQEAPSRPRLQRFYTVLPGADFGAPRVLPPAALLPQECGAGAADGATGEL